MKRTDINISKILEIYKQKNYKVNNEDKKEFALNILGIRSNSRESLYFDDYLVVFRKCKKPNNISIITSTFLRIYEQGYLLDIYNITTNPGTPNLLKPINKKGAGILAEGQYPNVYAKGLHKDYPALIQIGTFKVYRDNNKDDKFDLDSKTLEIAVNTGFNIHRASKWKIAEIIGLYSAGCQVFQNPFDFETKFMWTIDEAIKEGFKFFTYTLINETDITMV